NKAVDLSNPLISLICIQHKNFLIVFFFNETRATDLYTVGNTLSLHDALPISPAAPNGSPLNATNCCITPLPSGAGNFTDRKSTRLNSSHYQPSRMPSSA